jgi:hypothetical protein
MSFFEPLSAGLGVAARTNDADGEIIRFALGLIKHDPVGQAARHRTF